MKCKKTVFTNLKSFFLILVLLNVPAFSQSPDALSIDLFDQNGDAITAGIAFLTDSSGQKAAEIDISKTNKISTGNLGIGFYALEVQSPGFKTFKKTIEIQKGRNEIEVRLELEAITVNVNVGESEREKRIDEAFGGYLSKAEIDALPESGEDIKEELQRKYGDDVLIRIDGDFDGSQVPSRAEISSIKVIRNTFDAEFHEIGKIIIDIRTNSIASGFHGFGNLSFGNSNLNARNPFALKRQPSRTNNLIMVFSGPLIKKKTSFSISTFATDRIVTQNFIGTGVDGNSAAPQKTGQRLAFTTFGIKHNLPKSHTLNLKYQNTGIEFNNFGLGAFDLPERAATRSIAQHKFTVIESGVFKGKYSNDFNFQFGANHEKNLPKEARTTILVINAFNAGSSIFNNRTDGQKFNLTDNLLFDAKKHSLKLGTEMSFEKLQTVSANNTAGTFTFLNLEDYKNQKPAQFSQTLGTTQYRLSQLRTAFYFQDYFKTSKSVQLSLGVRYEWQNDLSDDDNFSPRFGYVWSPEKSGKFIVRGGVGIFYDWLDTQILSAVLSNDGRQARKIIIRNPGFPNAFGGGIVAPSLPASISKLADNLTTPSVFIAQNGFNYKPNKTVNFEGIYTLKNGWHHFRSRNINAPVNGVRPDANFGIIQLLESSGNSREHSFELKVNGYYKGINMFGNYEFEKTSADFSNALSLPMDNYNLRIERGATDSEQPHKLNVGFRFDIGKRINVSPSFKFESGLPYTITTGKDDNGDQIFNDRPAGVGRNTERGEWLKQIDLRVGWKLPLKYLGLNPTDKRRSVSLNINARNLLNTTNLINYAGIQTSPYFRRATAARAARSIEVGMSFGF